MGVTRVTAPDGATWEIRRRTLVWPRWRTPKTHLLSGDPFYAANWGGDNLLLSLAAVVLFVVLLGVAVFVLFPLVLFLGELVVLPFAVLLFRGARYVEARNEVTGEHLRFAVRGRRAARAREQQLAQELATAPSAPDAVRVLASPTS